MRRTLALLILFSLAISSIAVVDVRAQVVTLQQLDIDTSSVQSDQAFSVPTSIVVIPIFPGTNSFQVSDRDWYRGLFYYLTSTETRPGFTDIPFHYVVSGDGRVFKGNSGGEERKIRIDGVGDDQVVIGYLADRGENSFDPRSQSVIGELIVEVASRHNIDLDKVDVSTVEFVRDDESQTVSLTKVDLFGIWKTTLDAIVDDVRFLYSPKKKEYQVEVVSVRTPEEQATPGEPVIGTITIRNTGDFGIYGGTISELVGTKTSSGTSKFYNANNWLSTTQFSLMNEGDLLLPGTEGDFSFSLMPGLYFGEQTEAFRLKNLDGYGLPSTRFEVKLDVKKPKGTIVQVNNTETGWLRVRSAPSGAATEIDRVSSGERYFQVDDAGNGWVQLTLSDGTKGWVSSLYLTYL